MTRSVTILATAAALVLAACGADIAEETSTAALGAAVEVDVSTSTTEGSQEMQDSGTPVPPARTDRSYASDEYPAELGGFVAVATADLAAREGVDESEISVVSVEEVVWPDSAMGCPKPGMAYAQATQDGLRIVLDYEGLEYSYHSGGTMGPFLCVSHVPSGVSSTSSDPGGEVADLPDSTDGVLKNEPPILPKDSLPTDQPGGPGGQPND